MLKSNYFKLFMKINGVKFGKKLNLHGIPIIFKKKYSNLEIGDNCTIKSSFLSNLVGLSQRTIIIARTRDAKIEIGNNVGISGTTIYARKSISIGDNTLIGANVKILDNDFHPLEVKDRNGNKIDAIKSLPIIIGENCFIGCNSIILKGSKIGNGSIVGAGSVVSGSFEDNVIIAGNPAKVIKKLS
ncbi:Acetyltransferase (isoleucine patch superfamily) [Clostridium sp. DSM 8431]|uniref:acyltransferase n=1 Tax=Clostridium sp. DSM 8431 TaxID=1761781 RepID=UPI0008F13193|nr:acyltransferase [Clostridium sp. DSM 8431]SFU65904.1 Acetyltransferase (isoleucine patch superfamily) [Clostridium sp. DSM 8431]